MDIENVAVLPTPDCALYQYQKLMVHWVNLSLTERLHLFFLISVQSLFAV